MAEGQIQAQSCQHPQTSGQDQQSYSVGGHYHIVTKGESTNLVTVHNFICSYHRMSMKELREYQTLSKYHL